MYLLFFVFHNPIHTPLATLSAGRPRKAGQAHWT